MHSSACNSRWRRYALMATMAAGFVQAQYPERGRRELRHPPIGINARGRLAARGDDQNSMSTGLVLNNGDDFCLYGPPEPFSDIPGAQLKVVAWCTKAGHNARLIPDGTLQGVTFVKTPNYVQISGVGDLTKINIAPDDQGGQFDSNGHTPEGAWVSTSNGDAHDWVTLISATTFCFRACTGDAKFCPSSYDTMGCWWVMPGSMNWGGTYQNCQAEDGDVPGVYNGTSTYTQGSGPTPTPVQAPSLSGCQPIASIQNGQVAPTAHAWSSEGTPGAEHSQDPADPSATPNEQAQTGADGYLSLTTAADDSGSTSWMPAHTCVPCEGGSAVQDGAASVSTAQVGVTQNLLIGGAGGAATITTAPAATTKSAAGGFLGIRAEEETTTSNGQCCFTTWTPSIVSNAVSTAASSNPDGALHSASKSGLASGTKSSTKAPGASASAAGNATRNGTVAGGNSTGNGTRNGTDEGAARVAMVLDGGAWTLLLSVGFAGVLGGAGLLL